VLYVLSRVLRARYDLVYQLALLEGEVREILEGAPAPTEDGDADGAGAGSGKGRRKPIEGDCPICFCELAGEAVVWCRAACGQNVHKGCFETWAATKRRQGAGEVTCPFCRSVWEGDEDMVKKIQRDGKKNAEGYVNVASQLGISTQRGEFCGGGCRGAEEVADVSRHRSQHILEVVVWSSRELSSGVLLMERTTTLRRPAGLWKGGNHC
jgi:hypothetical protein